MRHLPWTHVHLYVYINKIATGEQFTIVRFNLLFTTKQTLLLFHLLFTIPIPNGTRTFWRENRKMSSLNCIMRKKDEFLYWKYCGSRAALFYLNVNFKVNTIKTIFLNFSPERIWSFSRWNYIIHEKDSKTA